ncbi:hypothetical protein DEU56DRAFT_347321 [Suillus clintonianus]|uniref:uncharacterized protein n=1 Tax=Suillus clintonianus TaxID=1904413 RepID=UPI001B870C8E|nr:uncharacterized protein DEU56DRAFT_347321 [Suillus clintonianus]KAG2138034.1 hypothetical protein DEU56DRAFT_347321 [Suillus clintonianus]
MILDKVFHVVLDQRRGCLIVYAGYVLDLQSHFPSQAMRDEDAWRNLALSLERELESLQQKRDEDEAELVHLRQNVSKDAPGDSDTAPPERKPRTLVKLQNFNFRTITRLQNGKVQISCIRLVFLDSRLGRMPQRSRSVCTIPHCSIHIPARRPQLSRFPDR